MKRSHSHAPSQVRRHRDGSVWPKRRMWQDRVARDKRFTPGAKSFLGLIASRSDDAGKPAWGAQVRIGAALGRSERSVRRYVSRGRAARVPEGLPGQARAWPTGPLAPQEDERLLPVPAQGWR